ncbi:MAG: cell division protein FtsQ/DivIB [Alphaproteobacteria bacterium]|nr:cell division protein FtsQ/DivIB [Alphaproteobacteria bacterium]
MQKLKRFLGKYAALITICLASAGLCLVFIIHSINPRGVRFEGVKFTERPRLEAARIAALVIESVETSDGRIVSFRDGALGVEWVKNAAAMRRSDGSVVIAVQPKAIIASVWKSGRYYPVAADGVMIDDPIFQPVSPVVYGEDAPKHTPALISILREYPRVAANVVGARLVDRGRWDLLLYDLDAPLTLRLSSNDIHESLVKISRLDERADILRRDIEVIDTRDETTVLVIPRGEK